jgi:hypothetical protein
MLSDLKKSIDERSKALSRNAIQADHSFTKPLRIALTLFFGYLDYGFGDQGGHGAVTVNYL